MDLEFLFLRTLGGDFSKDNIEDWDWLVAIEGTHEILAVADEKRDLFDVEEWGNCSRDFFERISFFLDPFTIISEHSSSDLRFWNGSNGFSFITTIGSAV